MQEGSQGDAERGNQFVDAAPCAGSGFRAAFGKTGGKNIPKCSKQLRNKEGLIPPLPLRKRGNWEPHTRDMEGFFRKIAEISCERAL